MVKLNNKYDFRTILKNLEGNAFRNNYQILFMYAITTLIISFLASSAFCDIKNQIEWDAAFNGIYKDTDPMLNLTKANENGEFSWQAHYWIRAYVSMAQIYDDTKYLDKAIKLIDFILYYRDDERYTRGEIDIIKEPYFSAPQYYLNHRNQAAPGWRIWDSSYNGWRLQTLDSGQITHAIMRFVDLVYGNKKFLAYQSKADEYIQKVEETVHVHDSSFVFGRYDGIPGSYYYPNIDGTGLYSSAVPFNHSATMGVTLLLLDKVKGGVKEYRQKAEAILDYFKEHVRLIENDAYDWDYSLTNPNSADEDFNHAHVDLSFIILAYHQGLELTDEDMRRFANTLTENIYQENGKLTWFIEGTNDISQDSYWPVGFDWIDLTEFNPFVLTIAKEFYSNNYSNPTWARPFLGWAEILRWSRIMDNNADHQPPNPPKNISVRH